MWKQERCTLYQVQTMATMGKENCSQKAIQKLFFFLSGYLRFRWSGGGCLCHSGDGGGRGWRAGWAPAPSWPSCSGAAAEVSSDLGTSRKSPQLSGRLLVLLVPSERERRKWKFKTWILTITCSRSLPVWLSGHILESLSWRENISEANTFFGTFFIFLIKYCLNRHPYEITKEFSETQPEN